MVIREHPVLGKLTWTPHSGTWKFEAGRIDGRPVRGVLVPGPGFDPLGAAESARVRRTVDWALANDPAIRAHVADRMWDWWRTTGWAADPDIATPADFARSLALELVRFEAGRDAYLVYADNGLVDHCGIRIYVGPDGQFTGGPMVC